MKSLVTGLLVFACIVILNSCRNDRAAQISLADGEPHDSKGANELTLSIIKPNAVADNHIGAIIDRFESNGLHIAGLKLLKLSQQQAEQFYGIHKDRPFYKDLVTFMTSGPVVVIALEGPNAIQRNREIMGATDPKKAAQGTIRADFAKSVTENAVHGSDAPETAAVEVAFFFKPDELFKQ